MAEYIDTIKNSAIANLSYMANSILNLKNHINNAQYYVDNLNSIKRRISDSTTLIIRPREIEIIDEVANALFSDDLTVKIFRRHKTLSERLKRFWIIFQELCDKDPNLVIYCITNLIEKKLPKTFTAEELDERRNFLLSNFLRSCKNVNIVTNFIYENARRDFQDGKFDVMSICGLLLSFCANSQTHLYFVEENIKKAINYIGKDYKIEDIFSVETPVIQNTRTVSDIRAIRNAISHASFSIQYVHNEYVVDFQGGLSGYEFDRKYTGAELLDIYSDYDNLRNFQEILIQIALLKATLMIEFITEN